MSRLDSIRVAIRQYEEAMRDYSAAMKGVDDGEIGVHQIPTLDEKRTTADMDFAPDAFEFLNEIMPALTGLMTAVYTGRAWKVEAAAHYLAMKLTVSQGGTE